MNSFLGLFAGSGGLSEGFLERSFEPVAFIEHDRYCCDTLRTRQAYYALKHQEKLGLYRRYLQGKISREELYKSVPQKDLGIVIPEEINAKTTPSLIEDVLNKLGGSDLDVMIGGPPCQLYSVIARVRNKDKRDDARWSLYEQYIDFLIKLRPRFFIFENVPGLKSIDDGRILDAILDGIDKAGYQVNCDILNASDYGVLQNRKRVFIYGSRDKNDDLSGIENNKIKKHEFTVRSILEDLPEIQHGETKNKYSTKANYYLSKNGIRKPGDVLVMHEARPHNPRDLEIYRHAIKLWDKKEKRLKYSELPTELKTHNNQHSFLDRFKVVGAQLPASHTMVAHIAKDGHYYIHPDIAQCRSISVREAARIQSFPDDYFFEGPRTAQFTQIGNAVPPLLSRHFAKEIAKSL